MYGMTYLKVGIYDAALKLVYHKRRTKMNGVILFMLVTALTYTFCWLLSYHSWRKTRDLFQYLILLEIYRQGRATQLEIFLYFKVNIPEVYSHITPKKKDVSSILCQCLKTRFVTQDDSEQPFLYYELTELGELWVENKLSRYRL